LRACLVDGQLLPVGANDSAMLAALSLSNALIIRDISAPAVQSGQKVGYYPIT
jgi:molybdopterin biosynthesis enzyme